MANPNSGRWNARVIKRLLKTGNRASCRTGGGAFMNDATRTMVLSQGLSVWLKADIFDVLWTRVSKREYPAPLLKKTANPRQNAVRSA